MATDGSTFRVARTIVSPVLFRSPRITELLHKPSNETVEEAGASRDAARYKGSELQRERKRDGNRTTRLALVAKGTRWICVYESNYAGWRLRVPSVQLTVLRGG